MIKVKKEKKNRICQEDIFSNIEFIEYLLEKKGIIEISKILFPYVIVLTQDCDLEQDFEFRWGKREPMPKTQDKYLLSVLVAPLYNIEHVYNGEHLTEIGINMEVINKNKSPGTFLRNDERPRYHYL